MEREAVILVLAGLFLAGQGLAYYSLGEPAGFVNDYAGTLSNLEVQRLESKIEEFERESSSEIAVVIIDSLEGDTIENFAVELFEEWEIGKEEKDNGVLILIAMEERRVRIEVGYGLEGSLTDAQSYWIIKEVVRPNFRKDQYYTGIDEALDKIMSAVRGEETLPSQEPPSSESNRASVVLSIFLFGGMVFIWLWSIMARTKSWWLGGAAGALYSLVVALFNGFSYGLLSLLFFVPLGLLIDYLVSRAYKKGKKRGHIPWWTGGRSFGGGSGGGGFGGFGGGSSGGGGASGGW